MAPLLKNFLCFPTYVIAREKQGKLLGGGAIADGTTDAINASVDGPLDVIESQRKGEKAVQQDFVLA
jgi:hypothetical protein